MSKYESFTSTMWLESLVHLQHGYELHKCTISYALAFKNSWHSSGSQHLVMSYLATSPSQAFSRCEKTFQSPVKHPEAPSKYGFEWEAKSQHALHSTIKVIMGFCAARVARVWCGAKFLPLTKSRIARLKATDCRFTLQSFTFNRWRCDQSNPLEMQAGCGCDKHTHTKKNCHIDDASSASSD